MHMKPSRITRVLTALLLVLALGALAACGSDEGDDASDATTSAQTETSGQTDAATSGGSSTGDGGSDSAGGTQATGENCASGAPVAGVSYSVVGIAADDPDGGLVVNNEPGTASTRLDVIAQGTRVNAAGGPGGCAIVSDGGVWWEIVYGDGLTGWVNARYLGASGTGGGGDETAAICDLYRQVLSYEVAPDFAPASLTSDLEAALDGPPVGVSDALSRISSPRDGADLATAYASVKSYVGPLCP